MPQPPAALPFKQGTAHGAGVLAVHLQKRRSRWSSHCCWPRLTCGLRAAQPATPAHPGCSSRGTAEMPRRSAHGRRGPAPHARRRATRGACSPHQSCGDRLACAGRRGSALLRFTENPCDLYLPGRLVTRGGCSRARNLAGRSRALDVWHASTANPLHGVPYPSQPSCSSCVIGSKHVTHVQPLKSQSSPR